jgi:hypothetical protein
MVFSRVQKAARVFERVVMAGSLKFRVRKPVDVAELGE